MSLTNIKTSPIHLFRKHVVKLREKETEDFRKMLNEQLTVILVNMISTVGLAMIEDINFILSTSIP